MAAIEENHTFKGTVGECFLGIKKFEDYPQYLPGVTQIEVLPPQADGSTCQVRYDLNLIKKFYYILDMYEQAPGQLSWELAKSNLMKINSGSWELKKATKKTTAATYRLEVKFKGIVPSAVTNRIAQANLPAMFDGFQQMIDDNC